MNRTIAQRQTRREMLRGTLRYLALGGISLGCAGLIFRGSGTGSPARDGCRWSPGCGDCAAIANCRLPQASAAKQRRGR